MGKLLTLLASLLALTSVASWASEQPELEPATSWATTVAHGNQSITKMEIYVHELVSGENATNIEVVHAPGSNQSFSGFGRISMFDDSLRVTYDPSSKLVGHVHGISGAASRPDGSSLITGIACEFFEGIYNGSTFVMYGLNPISNPVRELPVVAGTGLFRMASGYVIIRTHTFDTDTGILIFGYNVTLFH